MNELLTVHSSLMCSTIAILLRGFLSMYALDTRDEEGGVRARASCSEMLTGRRHTLGFKPITSGPPLQLDTY